MRAQEVAPGVLRGALLRVLLLLQTLLMVPLLLRERVTGNWTRQLVDHRRYAPQVCLTYYLCFIFLCIGDNCMFFLLGVG